MVLDNIWGRNCCWWVAVWQMFTWMSRRSAYLAGKIWERTANGWFFFVRLYPRISINTYTLAKLVAWRIPTILRLVYLVKKVILNFLGIICQRLTTDKFGIGSFTCWPKIQTILFGFQMRTKGVHGFDPQSIMTDDINNWERPLDEYWDHR